jgi:hypothetical protein
LRLTPGTVYPSSTSRVSHHQLRQRSCLPVERCSLPSWAIRAARPPSRSASGVSGCELTIRWKIPVTTVSPWTSVTAKVQLALCQGRATLEFARTVVDRLNMSRRRTGCGAPGRMYGPLRAQEARHHLTRRSGRTQVRQTQILRLLRLDQGKISPRYPGSRP